MHRCSYQLQTCFYGGQSGAGRENKVGDQRLGETGSDEETPPPPKIVCTATQKGVRDTIFAPPPPPQHTIAIDRMSAPARLW